MIILTINPGSSSLRYKVYDFTASAWFLIMEGREERIVHDTEYASLVKKVFDKINSSEEINGRKIDAIGCRVVHGGPKFNSSLLLDNSVLQEIRKLKNLAPLHNDIDATILETILKIYSSIPILLVFDTTFHQTLPQLTSTYALPLELSKMYSLKRYGFHGIAHQHVSKALCQCIDREIAGTKFITCHLGNGASICAIKDGKSFDTSMGLTPLEGLIMGTRSGDLDPGLILYLINYCGVSSKDLETILYHKSGLLGLSALSSDVRIIELAAEQFNINAELALDIFAFKVSKYIGSYYVALGGVDAIAFSGGIGENSINMRSRICKRLSCLGIHLDNTANQQITPPFCITTSISNTKSIPVWVIEADENLEIASQAFEFLK